MASAGLPTLSLAKGYPPPAVPPRHVVKDVFGFDIDEPTVENDESGVVQIANSSDGGAECKALLCIKELAKVERCDWDSVLEALSGAGDLTDDALDFVIAASADKLDFWQPDKEMLTSCRSVLREKLSAWRVAQSAPIRPGESRSDSASFHATTDFGAGTPSGGNTGASAPGAFVDRCRSSGPTERLARAMSRHSSTSAQGVFAHPSLSSGAAERLARALSRNSSPSARTKPSTRFFMSFLKSNPSSHLAKGAALHFTGHARADLRMGSRIAAAAEEAVSNESVMGSANPAVAKLKQFKWALFIFALMQMMPFAFYVVFHMTPETWDCIGLPIVIARGSAYGACFWTAMLFLTMSRDLISLIAGRPCVQRSLWAMQLLSCYKELHVFSAWEVLLDGFLHAVMHHIGTFVALEKYTNQELNEVFICAKAKSDISDGYIGRIVGGNILEPFQWPHCPLPEEGDIGYLDGILSTPGITGYLLLLVILALGWFSRQKKRRANFRLFYVVHHLLVPAWVVLLVIHGANDWVGLGFPLVVLVGGIPIGTYAWTRLRRQYLSTCCGAEVVEAVKSRSGRLLRLEVQLPPGYRACAVGQYAFINVPQIGWTEWHPFTISCIRSLSDRQQKITFCIMNAGSWTGKLIELFSSDTLAKPKLSVDGPFFAPTVSMPARSTVVGVGAGVGVTPFLSFLGGLAERKGAGHGSAHVFWMSSCATDFILFGDLLSEVDKLTASGGCNTKYHLHATPRFGGKGVGCLFDLLAREVWGGWLDRWASKGQQGLPVFCNYETPLYGVVSTEVLDSGKPVAVAVGRPDFPSELIAVGDADESEDVFVYFCGNPGLQHVVQVACASCNELRASQGKSQRFYFSFERFG